MMELNIKNLKTNNFTASVGTKITDRRQGEAAKGELPIPQFVKDLTEANREKSPSANVKLNVTNLQTPKVVGHVDVDYVNETASTAQDNRPININVDARNITAGTVVMDRAEYNDNSQGGAAYVAGNNGRKRKTSKTAKGDKTTPKTTKTITSQP